MSHQTAQPIRVELANLAANKNLCTSIDLDTLQSQSSGGESHHQGLARTHKLSDGSIYWFLAHSNLNATFGDYLMFRGNISQFRYSGRSQGDHVLETEPLTVAPMEQLINLLDPHPSDIAFLPDVKQADAGYLFVAEEYAEYQLSIYRWQPHQFLRLQGRIPQWFPQGGPNFVFIDMMDTDYYLCLANNNARQVRVLKATPAALFPGCEIGGMNVDAFQPAYGENSVFPFPPSGGPSQAKLIKDSTGAWFLLAFRSDPNDDPQGTDYVDVYPIQFSPFQISPRLLSQHVFFKAGDTGFANTGTHFVEAHGRLLVSSSYRWSKDEGPGSSSYVSRVDECPSSPLPLE
ncbi:MAG: hypothetical protein JO023_14760 [Chloroflexi bacterium]|nr:hypothetical protein [Chloroflexota bacterium]